MTAVPTFLGTPADSKNRVWIEDHFQMFIVSQARKAGYDIVASLEGLNIRSAVTRSKYKALGRTAGEPDLRVYLPMGRIVLIELKKHDGRLSESQVERHEKLTKLGHKVFIVYGETPWDAWLAVKGILKNAPPME